MALLTPISACGNGDSTAPGEHTQHETVARVVRTGQIEDVLTDLHGNLMITWLVTSEEDEGPSWLAWRTYSDDKRTGQGVIRQGSATWASAAETGFLLQSSSWRKDVDRPPPWRTVSPRGEVAATTSVSAVDDAEAEKTTRLPRRGDSRVGGRSDENYSWLDFYDASEGQIFTAAAPPGARAADVYGGAWSSDGVLYETVVRGRSLTVHATADEGRSWSRSRLPYGFVGESLRASEHNALMLEGARHPHLAVSTDHGRSWTTFSPRGLPVSDSGSVDSAGPIGYDDEGLTSSGRLLVGGPSTGWRLATDARNRVFRRVLRPPASARTTHLAVVGSRLFGFGEGHELWVTKDEGRHWSRFDISRG